MKYIYIDKKTKVVKMTSDKQMDLPQFEVKKIKATENLEGFSCKFENDQLIKNPLKQSKITAEEINNAQTIEELKEIIKRLL